MTPNDINIEILEKRLIASENSTKYSLIEIPGDKNEIFSYLISKLEETYKKNPHKNFDPFDFSMFDGISNFSVLHMLPIQFFYKILFETDILHPRTLATASDEFLQGAEINLLQALYFYKTFYVTSMNIKEYEDTFTILCLTEPNILFQPVDVEDNTEFWDITPFLEFCTKQGVSINHMGKALSILEKDDKDIINKFIAANLYNFESFKPLLKYCSKKELIQITHINSKLPELVVHDFFEYIYSRNPKTRD